MPLVMGVDSSTQACKVLVVDADSGAVVRHGRAQHPPGVEADPHDWERALHHAIDAAGGLHDVAAISVAAQQHGLVTLDSAGEVVRPALLWNDVRAAGAARELVSDLGGAGAWAEAIGSVPLASFTVSKLRWLARTEPGNAGRVAAACLPHDWLTWRLSGRTDLGSLATDRGDASGTGYWSPLTEAYRHDLIELAFGRRLTVPRVLGCSESAGHTPASVVLGAGSGDNAAAILGLDAAPGQVVVSVGTSGVACVRSPEPAVDATGIVASFASASDDFLPLVCTLNAARVLDAVARLLGIDHDALSEYALAAPARADGLVLVPYLEGERTPNLPDATGSIHGLTLSTTTPSHLARAAVEGMLCGLADAVDALPLDPTEVILIGGGAQSPAVRQIGPTVFGRDVIVPQPAEYVARGAARQAAWTLSQRADPPAWPQPDAERLAAAPVPAIREQYAALRPTSP